MDAAGAFATTDITADVEAIGTPDKSLAERGVPGTVGGSRDVAVTSSNTEAMDEDEDDRALTNAGDNGGDPLADKH